VFTLFSGAVGAGVLSLPKVVSYFGVAVGAVVIIFNAFLAYASYWALFQAIIASGKKRYANLICYYLGTVNFA
jgi:amino acid permease